MGCAIPVTSRVLRALIGLTGRFARLFLQSTMVDDRHRRETGNGAQTGSTENESIIAT